MTDHRSLSWLTTQPLVKGRLANWAYKLRNYDFNIVYRRGAENHITDLLSRAIQAVEVEAKGQVALPRWVRKDAERRAVLHTAMKTMDGGRPRPSQRSGVVMPTREKAHKNRPRRMEGNHMGGTMEAMWNSPISGEGERKTGASYSGGTGTASCEGRRVKRTIAGGKTRGGRMGNSGSPELEDEAARGQNSQQLHKVFRTGPNASAK